MNKPFRHASFLANGSSASGRAAPVATAFPRLGAALFPVRFAVRAVLVRPIVALLLYAVLALSDFKVTFRTYRTRPGPGFAFGPRTRLTAACR